MSTIRNRSLVTVVAAAMLAILLIGQKGFRATADDQNGLDAFRKTQADLNKRIDEDLSGATEYLDGLIKKNPDSEDLNVLRHSLAAALLKDGKYDEANQQFGNLLDFQIKHADQAQNQYGMWQTIQSMQEVTEQSRDGKALRESVDRAFEVLTAVDQKAKVQPLIPQSQLAVLKAQFLVDDEKVDEATTLVKAQVARLAKINDSKQGSEQSMRALVTMLTTLTSNDRGNDSWRDEFITQLDELTESALAKYPKSRLLQKHYAETQYMMITRWDQDDPDATKERIKAVAEKLNTVAARNRSVQAVLRRIDLLNEQMAEAKKVESLVGKPSPDWDIDAWVNVIAMERDDLKGKVVMLDFWAMWCGPCIATFPHLREWREEFSDDGFEIVGVTQYYNYEWNDERKRASRADGEVTPEAERATLASFLEHHKLEHPVIVTPEGSKMGSEFGVQGIPHVVLIGRDGVVQLVKTGAGEATAKEIHAKIKELISAKKK